MSDNLHDIKMYLDANKDKLPEDSEIAVKELFKLIADCITHFNESDKHMAKTNEWLSALKES